MTKNVQVMDGAENAVYDIFAMPDEDFVQVFPHPNQDVEFSDDVDDRPQSEKRAALNALDRCWERPVTKETALGIHGTIFYGLSDLRKLYPGKRQANRVSVVEDRFPGISHSGMLERPGCKGTKYIQLIGPRSGDGFGLYSVSDEVFNFFFPHPGQNIEFISDVSERSDVERFQRELLSLADRRVDRASIEGLHGTIFYGLDNRKRFYPTKID